MNKCNNCDACKRIYRIIGGRFRKYSQYYCAAFYRKTTLNDRCEQWRCKTIKCNCPNVQQITEVENDVKLLLNMFEK